MEQIQLTDFPENFHCIECERKFTKKDKRAYIYKVPNHQRLVNGTLQMVDAGKVGKCQECYDKKERLNYNRPEVFVRIVGYIRPVTQANPGKQNEIKDRKLFIIREDKLDKK